MNQALYLVTILYKTWIRERKAAQYIGFHESRQEAQQAALVALRERLGVKENRVTQIFFDEVLLYPELYYPGQKEDWGMYFGLFSLEAKGKIDSYIFFVEGNDLQSAKNAALERYQIPLSAPVVWDIIKKVTFSSLVPFGIDGVDLVG